MKKNTMYLVKWTDEYGAVVKWIAEYITTQSPVRTEESFYVFGPVHVYKIGDGDWNTNDTSSKYCSPINLIPSKVVVTSVEVEELGSKKPTDIEQLGWRIKE